MQAFDQFEDARRSETHEYSQRFPVGFETGKRMDITHRAASALIVDAIRKDLQRHFYKVGPFEFTDLGNPCCRTSISTGMSAGAPSYELTVSFHRPGAGQAYADVRIGHGDINNPMTTYDEVNEIFDAVGRSL